MNWKGRNAEDKRIYRSLFAGRRDKVLLTNGTVDGPALLKSKKIEKKERKKERKNSEQASEPASKHARKQVKKKKIESQK